MSAVDGDSGTEQTLGLSAHTPCLVPLPSDHCPQPLASLQASTPGLTFLAPKEFTKLLEGGQVLFQRPHDPTGKEAGTVAVTAEALTAVTGGWG
jgi:hypothetical protein